MFRIYCVYMCNTNSLIICNSNDLYKNNYYGVYHDNQAIITIYYTIRLCSLKFIIACIAILIAYDQPIILCKLTFCGRNTEISITVSLASDTLVLSHQLMLTIINSITKLLLRICSVELWHFQHP